MTISSCDCDWPPSVAYSCVLQCVWLGIIVCVSMCMWKPCPSPAYCDSPAGLLWPSYSALWYWLCVAQEMWLCMYEYSKWWPAFRACGIVSVVLHSYWWGIQCVSHFIPICLELVFWCCGLHFGLTSCVSSLLQCSVVFSNVRNGLYFLPCGAFLQYFLASKLLTGLGQWHSVASAFIPSALLTIERQPAPIQYSALCERSPYSDTIDLPSADYSAAPAWLVSCVSSDWPFEP